MSDRGRVLGGRAARSRVTLSVEIDRSPSDAAAGPEVQETYCRAAAHLSRDRDHAEMR